MIYPGSVKIAQTFVSVCSLVATEICEISLAFTDSMKTHIQIHGSFGRGQITRVEPICVRNGSTIRTRFYTASTVPLTLSNWPTVVTLSEWTNQRISRRTGNGINVKNRSSAAR